MWRWLYQWREMGGMPTGKIFQCFVRIILLFLSLCISAYLLHHNCLNQAKVLLPSLTHSSSSPTDICPCLNEVENLQQQTNSGGKWTHQDAWETPLAAKAGVYHVWRIHMSACKQWCRLCNFIPFKVYNEKFRGARISLCLMASDTTLRKILLNIIMWHIAILRAETMQAHNFWPSKNCLWLLMSMW